MRRNIQDIDFTPELELKAVKSSGPGGQNVNKVSTRIELRFDILNSNLLKEEEKGLIIKRLANKINKEGILIIVTQSTRSQLKNKEESIRKFYELFKKALKPVKKRISTSPSYSSMQKRLEKKKQQAEKKTLRSQDYKKLE